jgi:NAD(P) transhydrogenase subunit beta
MVCKPTIEFSYLLASILYSRVEGLSHPETAKRGMHMAEFGMLAIIGTLMHFGDRQLHWIIVGLCLVQLWASPWAWVPMTAMPQRTRSHAFGVRRP